MVREENRMTIIKSRADFISLKEMTQQRIINAAQALVLSVTGIGVILVGTMGTHTPPHF